MPKTNQTTNKKRTQVKDLPVHDKEMTSKEKGSIKGGVIGPCDRPRKNIVGPCDRSKR